MNTIHYIVNFSSDVFSFLKVLLVVNSLLRVSLLVRSMGSDCFTKTKMAMTLFSDPNQTAYWWGSFQSFHARYWHASCNQFVAACVQTVDFQSDLAIPRIMSNWLPAFFGKDRRTCFFPKMCFNDIFNFRIFTSLMCRTWNEKNAQESIQIKTLFLFLNTFSFPSTHRKFPFHWQCLWYVHDGWMNI